MKPPGVLVVLFSSLSIANSGASGAIEGLFWKSSTVRSTTHALRRARTPSVATPALWSSPRPSARVLRGGGGSSSSRRSSNGGVDGEGAGASNSRDSNLEPASPRPGGDVGARIGRGGEETVDHSSRRQLGEDGEASKPASSVAAPKQEQKGDAQEKALREALIMADGPNKILREVERIPALRRLSDSALRVTSATPADGRLAALALYRLGAEARAAEAAAATAAAAAAASAASSAVEHSSSSNVVSREGVGEGSVVSEGEGRGTKVESGARDGAPAEGESDGEFGGGEGSVSTAPPDGDGSIGGGAVAVAQAPTAEEAVDHSKKTEKLRTYDGVEDGAAAAADAATFEAPGKEPKHGSVHASVVVERPEDGASGSPATAETPDETAAAPPSKERRPEKEGPEWEEEAEEEATAAAAAAAAEAVPSTLAAFDMEHVKSDQRFEQLVEIVECVAGELSVSDISKVVWGLSILGHVPRNSLLESLAALLTDRFRLESGGGSTDGPPEITGGGDGGGERSAAYGGSATASGGEGGDADGRGSADAGAASEEGVSGADGRSGGEKSGGGQDGGGAVGETSGVVQVKAKAVGGLTTSGTDLATAALSFAYAHARLDISTGKLLEVIGACATPQLTSTPLRDLANLAWAFAVQRQLDTQMMKGVGREIVSDRAVGRMTAKDSSIFAWAYGMLGLRPDRVIRALTREGLATVHEATPQDLSNLAWGLARTGFARDDGGEFDGEEEVDDGDGQAGGLLESSANDGTGVDERKRKTTAQEEGEGEEETEGARMLQRETCDGDGISGAGGGGPWGLGWMRGKRRSRHWGRDIHGQEEEEDEEGGEGGKDEGEGGFLEVSTADGGAADGNADPVADLVDLAQPRGDQEVSSVEQRLGEAVLARANESLLQFQPKQLSRLCWALGAWHSQGVASLLPEAGLFVARALSEAGQRPKEYTAEELAQVLWAFATLVGNADSPAQELAGLVGALAEGFESEGAGGGSSAAVGSGGGGGGGSGGKGAGVDAATACDVLWSFATMGHPAHSLCEAMARDLVDKVPELPPSSVSSLVWAYAKMGHPSAELMERVLSVVERRLDEFSVEEVASSLWALGALGYTVSLKRQFDVTKEDLQSLSPSASANLLWGLAKTEAAFADSFDRECLEVLAADMGPKLLSFSPRELCRTAWALGRLGLGGIFGPGSVVDAGGGTDGDVDSEDGVYGSAPNGGEMSGLMDKLLGECSKWLEIFTPQDLETLLWAICRLEHRADKLVAEMAKEGKRRQDELPSVLQQSGPSAAKDAAFHLGAFRHLLAKYRSIDFDGLRAKGRYRRGKNMLSRMFRER